MLAKQETLILCGLAGVHIAELTGKSERAIKRQTIEMQEKGHPIKILKESDVFIKQLL